jgi:hypothetical protein
MDSIERDLLKCELKARMLASDIPQAPKSPYEACNSYLACDTQGPSAIRGRPPISVIYVLSGPRNAMG